MQTLDTAAHTIHLIEETVMIVNALYRNHVSYAVEREASRRLLGELARGYPNDDVDSDTAEIRRMVELSGMIGLECGLLERE